MVTMELTSFIYMFLFIVMGAQMEGSGIPVLEDACMHAGCLLSLGCRVGYDVAVVYKQERTGSDVAVVYKQERIGSHV